MADVKDIKADEETVLLFVAGGLMSIDRDPLNCRNIEALHLMGLINEQVMGFAMDVCLNDTDRWKVTTQRACENVKNICQMLWPSPEKEKKVSKI